MNDTTQPQAALKNSSSDPLEIHRRAIAIDMHADTAQRLVDEHVDLEELLPDGHFDAVRAKEGGLDAQFFSIWVEPELFGGGGPRAVKRADNQIAAWNKFSATAREAIEDFARRGDKAAMRAFLERAASPAARCELTSADGRSCATEARRVFLRVLEGGTTG